MNILIPLNSEYLINRYSISNDLLFQIKINVLPSLINRLSSDARIKKINIMSDLDFLKLGSHSSKVRFFKHNTGISAEFYKVVSDYIRISEYSEEILIIYNPLFPFISVDKLYSGYESLKNKSCNSSIGAYSNDEKLDDIYLASKYDHGIFSIIRPSDFLKAGSRLLGPINVVNLNAINLVSLRSSNDYDLFELIVNSGIM
jgi:hypothetical protein